MFVIVGWVVVLGCVLGGYVAMGGEILVLMQPFELVIIGGAAVGAFITGNPKWVIGKAGKGVGVAMKGPAHSKEDYLELLSMMYATFKLAKTKGNLALETHVENPHESDLFARFPKFQGNHHAVEFFCDYLRMLTMGSENSPRRSRAWPTDCPRSASSLPCSASSRRWDRSPSRRKSSAS
jgi:chemotaxis protein MotA